VDVADIARLPAARALRTLLARAARAALEANGATDAEVSITLLGDAAIQALNERWLGRARPTDVIAFPLGDRAGGVVGDVYIGAAEALRQAAAHDAEPAEELVRLAAHGTLHVLGYEHAEGEERTQGEMWALQERIVAETTGR
ncbi:MAG: rRNA maturation RNase YbeY, partial [Longimicrobiales bacterium]